MLLRIILVVCLSVLPGIAPVTLAQKIQQLDYATSEATISKAAAIKIAKNEVKGKVLSAKLIKSKGPAVYRVKMLVSDSRVRTVFVDGMNGKVIRIN